MTNNKGMTLSELLVVLSVVSILIIALGFQFTGWMGAYRVEIQTRDLYNDMLTARARAMSRNRMHFMRCISPFTEYSLYDDDSNGSAALADGDEILQTAGARPDTLLPTYPKTVTYVLTWGVGTGLGRIQFHRNGWIDTSAAGATGPWTIRLNATTDSDYDCILFTNVKINAGKWDGTNCVAK